MLELPWIDAITALDAIASGVTTDSTARGISTDAKASKYHSYKSYRQQVKHPFS